MQSYLVMESNCVFGDDGAQGNLGIMDIFIILMMIMVLWVHTHIKTHQTVHFMANFLHTNYILINL